MLAGSVWAMFGFAFAWMSLGVDVHVLVCVALVVEVGDVVGFVRGCNLGIVARRTGVHGRVSGVGS